MKSTKFGLLIPAICGLGLAGCFSADSIQNRTRPASTATPMASASPAASSPPVPMTDRSPNQKTGFAANLPAGFTLPNDDVGKRILREYGSMLVAKGVTAPPKLVFQGEADVAAFHGSVSASSETFGGIGVTLQSAALAVHSTDGMTADWVHLPYELLAKISNEIINQVRGINRVVYDISSKPPATIEWE